MPFFRPPFPYFSNSYKKNYNNYLNSSYIMHSNHTKKSNNNEKKEPNTSKEISKENYFFEVFGLKLYYDDILLVCLIFFLYNEGVKDDELFLSLILLLLS